MWPLPDADKIAAAGQGIFLYARYTVDELLANPAMLADPAALSLPRGLDGHYREFLERELASNHQRWARFRPLLALLAVARGEGLNASELAGAANLRRSEVDDALGDLSQYLTSTTAGRFRLYHQSFRDFVLSNPRYPVYPLEANEALERFFIDEYGDNWLTAEHGQGSLAYGIAHTPAHLVEAFRLSELRSERRLIGDELCALLTRFDFLEAKAARLGFDAVYLSGAALSAGTLALPDVGLFTLTELAQQTAYLSRAVNVPVVVDADTGFGDVLNVERTIVELEAAGAAAIQLEDQQLPKRCGHLSGKSLVEPSVMAAKLRAAAAARRDADLVLIARTDARGVTNLDDAIPTPGGIDADDVGEPARRLNRD